MKVEELKAILKDTEDKFSILSDREKMNQVENMTNGQYIELVVTFLNDTDKEKILEVMKLNEYIKRQIIQSIKDDSIKIRILFEKDNGLSSYSIIEIIKGMDDTSKIGLLQDIDAIKKYGLSIDQLKEIIQTLENSTKIQLLRNSDFMQYFMQLELVKNTDLKIEGNLSAVQSYRLNTRKFDIARIIESLNHEEIKSLLEDKAFLQEKLGLEQYHIEDIIKKLNEDQIKLDMIDYYQLEKANIANILETLSDEVKTKILLEGKYNLSDFDIESIISTMDIPQMEDFIKHNKEFLNSKELKSYRIIRKLNSEKQLEFISRIENMDYTLRRKKTNIGNITRRNKTKTGYRRITKRI